jgi:NAD(P)-dependent dehydrogenase (short-subunit alcohol dehydrogenase family)
MTTQSSIGMGSPVNNSGILQGKRAVVFGAGGTIGAAVAKEFAAEGAEVFLAGRTQANVEEIASQISKAGGTAHAAVVDALDDAAVNKYLDGIVSDFGRIDIEFNAVGPRAKEYGPGKHAVDLTIEEFMLPMNTMVKAQFITARAAVRHMIKRRSGVVFFLTGSPARGHGEGGTSVGTACGALEILTENLAIEVGPHGVRALCLRTAANVDSRTMRDLSDGLAVQMNVPKNQMQEQFAARLAGQNFLKVPVSTSNTAKLAALLASDRVPFVTGTTVNSTAGAAMD